MSLLLDLWRGVTHFFAGAVEMTLETVKVFNIIPLFSKAGLGEI